MKQVRTVCIIDDDPVYQFATQKIVEYSELVDRIICFSEAEAALGFLKENAHEPDLLPDLLFLDLNMPLVDGWEFLRRYAEIKPQLDKEPFICIVTSSTNPTDTRRAEGYSDVFDYIVKPLMPEKFEELNAKIGRLKLGRVRSAS